MSSKTIVVVGAGAMGRITLKDLVETAPDDIEIVVADYDAKAAKRAADEHRKRGVRAVRVDVKNAAATAKALKGSFGVIGAIHHSLNLSLMDACLRIGAHYTDLGGLFHETHKQLKLHKKWVKAGKAAILGMGAAPGIVNVLARSVADEMERVDEIHIYVGNVDRTVGRASTPLGSSYSLATILDEASMPAALFTGGKPTFVPAMSGAVEMRFPAPVGVRHPSYTIHSEVATLPLSFADKGVREVSFRIAFSDEFTARLRFLNSIGALSGKPIAVGKQKVAPRDVVMALAAQMKAEPFTGTPDEYEVLRVVVRGAQNGRDVEETVDCHCPGIPAWGMGVDVDTGCPPSIVMQLLARGVIDATGVVAPEVAVPAKPFFAELAKRGMRIDRQRRDVQRVA